MVRNIFTERIRERLAQPGVSHANGSRGFMADEMAVVFWFILVSAGGTTSSLPIGFFCLQSKKLGSALRQA